MKVRVNQDVVHDLVIVGGGPAGLAAASASPDNDLLLLERAGRLGGRMHSLSRGQGWINLAAHLLTGGESLSKELAMDVGLDVLPVPGVKTALWFDGRLYRSRRAEKYPFVLPLTLNERVGMIRGGLRLRLLVEVWRRAVTRRAGESAVAHHERVSHYQVGRTMADLIADVPDRVAAIFRTAARRSAGEADDLSLGGALALFGALWVSESSSSVVNVDGGSGRLGEAWLDRLGDRVVLDAEVTAVVERPDRVEVRYCTSTGEQTVSARKVIVTTPAPVVADIVDELPDDVAADLRSMAYGPFVCLGVLTDDIGSVPWDDTYAIASPGLSFDMLFNHTSAMRRDSGTAPGVKSLMCYAGGRSAEQLIAWHDDDIRATFLSDLQRVLPQVAGHVREAVVVKWEHGNVYPTSRARLGAVLQWNQRPGGRVILAGDYFAPLGGTVEAAVGAGLAAARLAHGQQADLASASPPVGSRNDASPTPPPGALVLGLGR